MKRREFMAALSSAVAWPVVARAQQPDRVRRVSVLMGTESDPETRARIAALRDGLQELGWIEDRNIRIDVIWGDADHVETDAIALVRKSPDVIVTNGPVPTLALKRATPSIPVVSLQMPDPVDLGIVASLARPGANLTGFTNFEPSFGGKWMEALKEMAPRTEHVLMVSLANHPAIPTWARAITECSADPSRPSE
jgi:putative ABC transport system substrate-binding protein